MTLLVSRFFIKSFLEALIALLPVTGVFFSFLIHSCQWLSLFCLSSFLAGLKGFATLAQTDFISLALDFSRWGKFLAVILWVCTFEAVLLERRWLLEQQISESRTMVLDFRLALTSALIAFCTISSKFTDSPSCCFISTLIEGLRSFRK